MSDLFNVAPRDVLAKMAAGDPVQLRVEGQNLKVDTSESVYLGEVEPKLGLRLTKLMAGGNNYLAAIASVTEDKVKVMIKEVFQHPSQAGRPSFPARAVDDFRPYLKNSMLKYEREDDEEDIEEEYPGESVKEVKLQEDTLPLEEVVDLVSEEEVDEFVSDEE